MSRSTTRNRKPARRSYNGADLARNLHVAKLTAGAIWTDRERLVIAKPLLYGGLSFGAALEFFRAVC